MKERKKLKTKYVNTTSQDFVNIEKAVEENMSMNCAFLLKIAVKLVVSRDILNHVKSSRKRENADLPGIVHTFTKMIPVHKIS